MVLIENPYLTTRLLTKQQIIDREEEDKVSLLGIRIYNMHKLAYEIRLCPPPSNIPD